MPNAANSISKELSGEKPLDLKYLLRHPNAQETPES